MQFSAGIVSMSAYNDDIRRAEEFLARRQPEPEPETGVGVRREPLRRRRWVVAR